MKKVPLHHTSMFIINNIIIYLFYLFIFVTKATQLDAEEARRYKLIPPRQGCKRHAVCLADPSPDWFQASRHHCGTQTAEIWRHLAELTRGTDTDPNPHFGKHHTHICTFKLEDGTICGCLLKGSKNKRGTFSTSNLYYHFIDVHPESSIAKKQMKEQTAIKRKAEEGIRKSSASLSKFSTSGKQQKKEIQSGIHRVSVEL